MLIKLRKKVIEIIDKAVSKDKREYVHLSRNQRAMMVLKAQQRNAKIREVKDGVDESGILEIEETVDYIRIVVGNENILPFLRKCDDLHVEVKIKVLEIEEDWRKY